MKRKSSTKKALMISAFSLFAIQLTALNTSFAKIEDTKPIISQTEQTNQGQETEEYKIFISTGCPHCAAVEEFVESSNLNNLTTVTFFDTSVDPTYTDTMVQLITERGYEYEGVPTMIAGDEVVVGDTPIMDYFRTNFPELEETTDTTTAEPEKDPIDWGKWTVIGLVGISGLVVVVMIVMSFV